MTDKMKPIKHFANKDNLSVISGLMDDYKSLGNDKIFEHVRAHVERGKILMIGR
jgi:hypothetical protein